MVVAMTGRGDLRDQRWLDDRIASIEDGVQAVIDIARNWTEGRDLARLHPGVSAAEYVTSRVGTLGKAVVPVLLAESNWSNRQIAAVAGVDEGTVRNVARAEYSAPRTVLGADGKTYAPRVVEAVVIDTPIEEEPPIAAPVDPALWHALTGAMDQVEALAERDASEVAATVPDRRRAATAKRLRKLGTALGSIAWSLEREEYVS